MGAQIVAQLVTSNPDRFITATLGGASGRWKWSDAEERISAEEANEMEEGVLRSMILRVSPTNRPKPTEEEMKAESARRLAGLDNIALAAVRRSIRDLVVAPSQLATVRVPTMGITGSSDPALKDFKELKQFMPQPQLVVIDGASHVDAPRRPEFIQALVQFLRGHPF